MAYDPAEIGAQKALVFSQKFNDLLQGTGKSVRPVSAQDLRNTFSTSLQSANTLHNIAKGTIGPKKVKDSGIEPGAIKLTTAQKLVKATQDSGSRGIFEGLQHTAGKGFGQILHQLGRIPHTGFEAARNAVESVNAGEPIWSLGDDVIYGAISGGILDKQTGWGDVVNEGTKYKGTGNPRAWEQLHAINPTVFGPQYPGMELRDLEAMKLKVPLVPDVITRNLPLPDAYKETLSNVKYDPGKAIRYGVSFAGEIGLDPLTYVGGGAATKLSEKGIKALEEAGVAEAKALKGAQSIGAATEHGIRTTLEEVNSVLAKNPSRWKAEEELVSNAADNVTRTVNEIGGGAHKGKLTKLTDPVMQRQQAGASALDYIRIRMAPLEAKIAKIPSMKPAQIARLEKTDPLFEAYYKVVKTIHGTHEEGLEAVRKFLAPEVRLYHDTLLGNLADMTEKVPVLKFMGNEIAEFPRLGRVGSKAIHLVTDTKTAQAIYKTFSYSGQLEGFIPNIIARARAIGDFAFERNRANLINVIDKTGVDEAVRKTVIHDALENGTPLVDNEAILHDFINRSYIEDASQRRAAGLRDSDLSTNAQPTQWTQILKGKRDDVKKFYELRDAHMRAGVKFNGVDEAKKLGLVAETDPAKNLLYRQIKSNRDLTAHYVHRDTIGQYAVKGALDSNTAHAANLVELKDTSTIYGKIVKDLKSGMKPGDKVYLDKDIHEFLKTYRDMLDTGIKNEHAENLVRSLDYVTKKFKVMNTIYWPGFHVKNFLSDMYFGALDGVKTRHYKDIIEGFTNRNAAKLKFGNKEVPFNTFYEDFQKSAVSGGYFSAELGQTAHTLSKEGSFAERVSGIPNTARRGAELREDFGRFTHFYAAMQEEYPAALRRGFSPDVAWDRALDNSLTRVNKMRFDYGALTKVEQKYIRRGIPFYTYTRKAIPAILESIWLSPRYLNLQNKLTDALNKNSGLNFLLPDWMREMGFARISDNWGVTDDPTPNATLRNLVSNPAAQINPVFQIPIEASLGRNLFTKQPIPGKTFLDRMLDPKIWSKDNVYGSKFRGTSTINAAAGNTSAPGMEQLFNFFGIPIREATEARQTQKAKSLQQDLQGALSDLNNSKQMDGLHAFISTAKGQISIKVRDEDTGEIVAEFNNYEELQANLPG